ncbi:MAG: aldo/keto reductase [Cyclobacteriaceae bacterium]
MQRINLSGSLELSRLVFGVWRLGDWQLSTDEIQRLIEQNLDLGISSYDHADIYGDYTCEELFGRVLAQSQELRGKMEIITKCGIKLISKNRPDHKIKYYDTSRDHIIASAEQSLKNLHTDYIDLLLLHRPDPLTDPEEVADAFRKLKSEGKVLHFGVSNFSPMQFDMLNSYLDEPLITNQVEISALCLDQFKNGAIEHCQLHNIHPMAWSPLGGGSVFTGQNEQAIRVREVLTRWSEEKGKGMDQLLFAWLLRHPANIIPILGTGKIGRVEKAIEALEIDISRQEWFELWQVSAGEEVP